MKCAILPVTPLMQNCSLLICEKTGRGAVIDPGGDIERILALAEQENVALEKIFITHGHIDHAGGAAELAEKKGIPIEGPHEADLYWIEAIETHKDEYGIPKARRFTPTRWLQGGETVRFGAIELAVHHCPGHTPGHVVFYEKGENIAFVGDVLFQGSIGRTDFPGGDFDTLIASIQNELWPLGGEVTFVPGHGPLSTFGEERQSNPFVADHVLARGGG